MAGMSYHLAGLLERRGAFCCCYFYPSHCGDLFCLFFDFVVFSWVVGFFLDSFGQLLATFFPGVVLALTSSCHVASTR